MSTKPSCQTDEQQPNVQESQTILQLRDSILARIAGLGATHGWNRNGRVQTTSVMKLLLENVCESRTQFILKNKDKSETTKKFDPFFKIRSEFVVAKLIAHIESRLLSEGFKVLVATEIHDEHSLGIYDVVIYNTNPCRITSHDLEIRAEVKASHGMDLSQIERYMLQPTTLILIRALTGQVARIVPSKYESFLKLSLNDISGRIDRLGGNGNVLTVPGNYCAWCENVGCDYNKSKQRRNGQTTRDSENNFVSESDSDFQHHLDMLFSNLQHICERTAEIVIEELRNSSGNHLAPNTVLSGGN